VLFFSSVFSNERCDDFVTLPTRPLVVDTGGLVLTFDSVLSKLARIKINKSAGPDSIYPRVLYELFYEISIPLLQIFQRSSESKVLPLDWKEASCSYL